MRHQAIVSSLVVTAVGITLAFAAPLCALGTIAKAEPAGAEAGQAEPALFGARFVLADGGPERIASAVEGSLAEASPFVRPIARRRLLHTNRAFESVRFERDDQRIVARLGPAPPVVSPADGSPAWYAVPGAKRARVRQVHRDRVLVQHYRNEDGTRVNRFVLSPDGESLHLTVVVRSEYLPEPVRYALQYEPAGG